VVGAGGVDPKHGSVAAEFKVDLYPFRAPYPVALLFASLFSGQSSPVKVFKQAVGVGGDF